MVVLSYILIGLFTYSATYFLLELYSDIKDKRKDDSDEVDR